MSDLTDRQCALMVLLSLKERSSRRAEGRPLTRARFTKLTLKRLCERETITQGWIDRVNESLMKAGWVLIDAGSTFGAVKINVVENWPRATSKNLKSELDQVKKGTFKWNALEQLMRKETWETTTHLRGRNRSKSAKNRKRGPDKIRDKADA
jgi:hypothetical protein